MELAYFLIVLVCPDKSGCSFHWITRQQPLKFFRFQVNSLTAQGQDYCLNTFVKKFPGHCRNILLGEIIPSGNDSWFRFVRCDYSCHFNQFSGGRNMWYFRAPFKTFWLVDELILNIFDFPFSTRDTVVVDNSSFSAGSFMLFTFFRMGLFCKYSSFSVIAKSIVQIF